MAKTNKTHAADVAAATRVENAVGFTVKFRVNPKKTYDGTAETFEAAVAIAMQMNAEHGKNGRRACIYAVQGDGRVSEPVKYDHDPKPTPEAVEKAPEPTSEEPVVLASDFVLPQPALPIEPTNDLTALPKDGGPYVLQVHFWAQHSLIDGALFVSRKIGELVQIIDKKGRVVRTMDGRVSDQPKARKARAANGSSPGRKREAKPMDEMANAIFEMAISKDGAARTAMTALNAGVCINWKGYVERLGKGKGLVLAPVDKSGATPVYRLVSASP